jgi:hypothetical protein
MTGPGASAPGLFSFMPNTKERLEELRQAIRAENISYGEICELQSLADSIEPGDVELLQWAGVPENQVQ